MLWLGQFAEAQRICREASPEAAGTMAELLKSDDDRVRLMAADKLLERAWGKPRDYDPKRDAERPSLCLTPGVHVGGVGAARDRAEVLMEPRTVVAPEDGRGLSFE